MILDKPTSAELDEDVAEEGTDRYVLALDTETTGINPHHGSRPFFVTVCFEDGRQRWWQWDVDPLTREPVIPPGDLAAIGDLIFGPVGDDGPELVLHNSRFDIHALQTVMEPFSWPWERTHDTLHAAHLLGSNLPKNLTDLVMRWLGLDIQPFEDALEDAVKSCRRMVQQARLKIKRSNAKGRWAGDDGELDEEEQPDSLAAWRIADADDPSMPSAGSGKDAAREDNKIWRGDGWLPRAMVKHLWETSEAFAEFERQGQDGESLEVAGHCASRLPGWEHRPPSLLQEGDPGHPWWTVLRDYANPDSACTAALWPMMRAELERLDLWDIYLAHGTCLCRVAYGMESRGTTCRKSTHSRLLRQYGEEVEQASRECLEIAESFGYDLIIPNGASPNHSLRHFFFGRPADVAAKLGAFPGILKPIAFGKSGPSLDKNVLEQFQMSLDKDSREGRFISNLMRKRKRDSSLAYLKSYERFWLPAGGDGGDDCRVIHSSLNPVGTDHLRWSSSNPNSQNLSKKGVDVVCLECNGVGCRECGDTGRQTFNLRHCFGPAPGREWWSLDAQNIELRIPAYESGEQELIDLFERSDEPPYWGSEHLLNFSTVYPDIWEPELPFIMEDKEHIKKKFKDTWYQWVKNGDFAVGYQAQDSTADKAFHRPGSRRRLIARFSKKEALNQRWVRYAEKHGFVETIPDKSVNPRRGYPILCSRSEWGKIVPTVPLNYHVSGTACWWACRALVKVQAQLDQWREMGFDGHITLYIHDEIVLDLPRSAAHPREDLDPKRRDGPSLPRKSNLWRVRKIQKIMESCGLDLDIPTPVGCEYHTLNWAEGETI